MRTGFDGRAERYEELRPVDDNWWQVFDALVRLGALRQSRVLEIGCGTGRLAQAEIEKRLHEQAAGFVSFVESLRGKKV